jgi:predicted RNA-binding protein with PIN domain
MMKRSPQEKYIIDGYNVMHFSSKFKNLLESKFELARELFVQNLSNYFSTKKNDVIVVFDGSGSSEINSLSTKTVKVMFSSPHKTADNKIKSLIDSTKNKALTFVVSSDNEVLEYARVSRCRTLKSQEFNKKLSRKTIDYENNIKSHLLTQNEIEAWKEIFNKKGKI